MREWTGRSRFDKVLALPLLGCRAAPIRQLWTVALLGRLIMYACSRLLLLLYSFNCRRRT